MEPPYQFQFLDIQQCWPASEQDLLRYVEKIRPSRAPTPIPAPGRPLSYYALPTLLSYSEPASFNLGTTTQAELSPHSVLQVCLLTMTPFQGGTDNGLQDTRDITYSAQHSPIFRCANRPLLIETLADALLKYERDRYEVTQRTQTEPAYRKQAMEAVIWSWHCQVVEVETRIRRAAAPLPSYLLSRRPAPYP